MNSPVTALIGSAVNIASALLIAPLMQGVMRKVTARLHSRVGPPVLQPYYDLLKLLAKEDIESGVSAGAQRLAVALSLATVLAIACYVPMGFPAPLSGAGDVILLIALLTLSGTGTVLAGLAAGSTYSLLGTSRQMMIMIALEPLIGMSLIVGAMHVRSLRIDAVLNGSVYAAPGVPWSGIIMLGVTLAAFQAFVERAPFDQSEAETELMEGPRMEYSGPKLAIMNYAAMVKLVLYGALFTALFMPWGATLPLPLAWVVFWLKIFGIALVVAVVAATHARYRIDQALRYFAVLLMLALAAVVLAGYGF